MRKISTLILLCLTSLLATAQSPRKTKEINEKFEFVIEFVSKGSGIDSKTKEKIDDFIKKNEFHPSYDVCLWGREGETDYLFTLKEMKHHERKKFMRELHELITDHELVVLKEDYKVERRCR